VINIVTLDVIVKGKISMVKSFLGAKFKHVRTKKLLTQQEFAKALGISAGFVSEIEQGNKLPGSEVLSSLKKTFGTSIDWLFTEEDDFGDSIVKEDEAQYENDFVLISQMRGLISAGGGLVPDNVIEMRIAFRKDWIQHRGDPKNMSLIRVSGDSMEPTLFSGDLVLVDHGRNYIDPQGGIYAVAIDHQIMIKRIQILLSTGKVIIISDNGKYQPIEIDPSQIKINGKIIWFGREIER